MASTGDLRVVVTSDSGQFRSDMANNAGAIRRFKSEVNGSSGGGSNKLLEFGRLAEDFSIGYQLQGMTGALRASSNNITQLASQISPLAGGIAGLGVAAIGLVPTFLNMGTAAEDGAKGIDKQTEAIKRLGNEMDQAQRRAQTSIAIDKRGAGIGGADAGKLFGLREEFGAELKQVGNDQFRDVARLRMMIPRELDAQVKAFTDRPSVAMGEWLIDQIKRTPIRNIRGELMPGMGQDQLSAVGGVISNLVDAQSKQTRLQEQIGKIDRELPAANRRQEEAARRGVLEAAVERRNALFAEQERMKNETLTPAEKLGRAFDSVTALRLGAEREGVALDSKITGRFQIGALKDFAKASGLLTEAGKLTGATRGSSDDFSARIGANTRDPATLLERQLNQMQKDGAKQDELVNLMKKLVDSANEPPVVLEF